jgi:hypothetical protein
VRFALSGRARIPAGVARLASVSERRLALLGTGARLLLVADHGKEWTPYRVDVGPVPQVVGNVERVVDCMHRASGDAGAAVDTHLMEWTPPFSTGIEVPKWRCKPTTAERERHNQDYDDRDRSGKGGVASAWGRQAWEGGAAQAAQAQGRDRRLRESRTLPDTVWQSDTRAERKGIMLDVCPPALGSLQDHFAP